MGRLLKKQTRKIVYLGKPLGSHLFWLLMPVLFLLEIFHPLKAQSQNNSNFLFHYKQQVSEIVELSKTPNQELIAGGKSKDDILLARFQSNGASLWARELSDNGNLTFGDIAVDSSGLTWLTYQVDRKLVIATLNGDGSLNWRKSYQRSNNNSNNNLGLEPESLVNRGSFMTVFGFTEENNNEKAFTLGVNLAGDFQSFQTHTNPTGRTSGAAAPFDFGLIVGYNQTLLKLGGSSQPLVEKQIQSPLSKVVNIEVLPNGDFYVLMTNLSGSQFQLVRLNEQANLVWQTKKLEIPGSASTQASGLALTDDGGVFITGRLNTAGTTPRNLPAVYKVSAQGKFESIHYFVDSVTPNPVYANAFSIVQGFSSEQSYYLTGKSSQVPSGGDLFLSKADSILKNPNCVKPDSFLTSDRASLTITDQSIDETFETRFDINTLSEDVLNNLSLQRSLKCKACKPLSVDLGPDTTICPNAPLTLNSGIRGETQVWSNGIQDQSSISVQQEGSYWVSVNTICGKAGDTINIRKYPTLDPGASFSPKEPDPGDAIELTASNDLINNPVWRIDSNTKLRGQTVSHTYEEIGRYQPLLSYTGQNNCRLKDTLGPIPVLVFNLFMPEAFSPDGNDMNEVFKPMGTGLKRYKLKVYNRWGEKVFTGENEGWNGMINNEPAKPGVYLYKLRVRTAFQDLKFREGTFTLIR